MPGEIQKLTPAEIVGVAVHPIYPEYQVSVHALVHGRVVRSTIADWNDASEPAEGKKRMGLFRLDLRDVEVTESDLTRLQVVIGETDEDLELPGRLPPILNADVRLTVEDLLAFRPKRRWVKGGCEIDAEKAGLTPQTIVDMLYRDILGRPADPHGLANYSEKVATGVMSYADIRRAFFESSEYLQRDIYADYMPGAIFSQRIVLLAAHRDFSAQNQVQNSIEVSAAELLALSGAEFLSEAYRRILRKDLDEGGRAHYLHELSKGRPKLDILRHLAADMEAISAGVRLVATPDKDPTGAETSEAGQNFYTPLLRLAEPESMTNTEMLANSDSPGIPPAGTSAQQTVNRTRQKAGTVRKKKPTRHENGTPHRRKLLSTEPMAT